MNKNAQYVLCFARNACTPSLPVHSIANVKYGLTDSLMDLALPQFHLLNISPILSAKDERERERGESMDACQMHKNKQEGHREGRMKDFINHDIRTISASSSISSPAFLPERLPNVVLIDDVTDALPPFCH